MVLGFERVEESNTIGYDIYTTTNRDDNGATQTKRYFLNSIQGKKIYLL